MWRVIEGYIGISRFVGYEREVEIQLENQTGHVLIAGITELYSVEAWMVEGLGFVVWGLRVEAAGKRRKEL